MLFNLASMPDTLQTIHNIFELQNILIIQDRKSTRLNSSHQIISYAVFCLKKKITRLNSIHQIISYAVFCLKKKHKPSIDAAFRDYGLATQSTRSRFLLRTVTLLRYGRSDQ